MRRSNALQQRLETLTRVYHGEHRVPVEFGKPSRAVPAGGQTDDGVAHEDTVVVSPNVKEELGRDLDGAQELRTIINTLSHEIEHIRASDLTSKEEFMSEYPEYRNLAGAVINILEDQYIDHQRTQRYPGLRKAQCFVVASMMENHHRRPRVDNIDRRPKAVQEGLTQVAFAGYAKGIQDADDWLRECLGRVRPIIDEVRTEDDQQERVRLAHECMDVLLEYLPDDGDVDIPDECAVCGGSPVVVLVPTLGAVCSDCAPGGHDPEDGTGGGKRPPEPDQPDPEQQPGDEGDGGAEQPGDGDGDAEGDEGAGDGGDEGDGDGDGGDGAGDEGGDDFGGGGQGSGDGEPEFGDGGGGGDIDPTEWDWLDLESHSDHTVSIVDDDAEV